MGTCGAKPNHPKKQKSVKNTQNQNQTKQSYRGVSFIQQVLTINGVKGQIDENLDSRKILQQLQQNKQDIDIYVEKKILLSETKESSLLKRRSVANSQNLEDSQDKQKYNSPSILQEQSKDKSVVNQKYSNRNIYTIKSIQFGSEQSTNYSSSTTNCLQQNLSNSQLKPPVKPRNNGQQRKSAKSLENIIELIIE